MCRVRLIGFSLPNSQFERESVNLSEARVFIPTMNGSDNILPDFFQLHKFTISTMLMLFLLPLHVVLIDWLCPPLKRVSRAIVKPDKAGFGTGQYSGFGNTIDTTPSYDPEGITILGPDDLSPSTEYFQQPSDGSTRIVAELDYGSLYTGSKRLACCKPMGEELWSTWAHPRFRGRWPSLPPPGDPHCIWSSDFDPDHEPVHDATHDWCLDQYLACCDALPSRYFPLWSECVSLGLPENDLDEEDSPDGEYCGVGS